MVNILFSLLYYSVAGEDFMIPMIFNAVFPASETEEGYTSCAAITIIDDEQLEGDEQDFTIHIVNIDPPDVLSQTIVYAIVRIQDNDEDGKLLNQYQDNL
jgi:hypothetical protein